MGIFPVKIEKNRGKYKLMLVIREKGIRVHWVWAFILGLRTILGYLRCNVPNRNGETLILVTLIDGGTDRLLV